MPPFLIKLFAFRRKTDAGFITKTISPQIVISPHDLFYIIEKINGIVITASKCEITVIPAAIDVSFPSALGITIVFNPSGIDREQTTHI